MRISIKHKFTLAFLIIFLLSALIFVIYMKTVVEKHNETIVSREMTELMFSTREYLKQYFVINDLQPSSAAFKANAEQIARELSQKTRTNLGLYSSRGELHSSASLENQEIILADPSLNPEIGQDLELARKNKAAASILNLNGNTYVKFSFPVYVAGKQLGIVRTVKNFTEVYRSSATLLALLTAFTGALFILLFAVFYILSAKIINPLWKLRLALKEVASGNYQVDIKVNSRDEIGDLARDFCHMQDKIKEQIATIQNEHAKLLRAEKYRQEFFNNVTHELKTPLTTISGYAQILEEEAFSREEMYRKAVGRIKAESARLHSLVVELIQVSKESSQVKHETYEKIDLSTLVLNVCQDMELKAQKYNMTINPKLFRPLFIEGIAGELKGLLINLLDNAIKYGKENSNIIVKISREASFAVLEVQNSGRGIPKDKLDKVFDSFYRIEDGKKVKDSFGLGLYICRNIVQKHHGTIAMESVENQYTKVIVKIPLTGNNLATNE